MKMYHGTPTEIAKLDTSSIYVSPNYNKAKGYSLTEDGDYGFVYEFEVDENDIELEEDFDCVDCGGYLNPESWDKKIVLHEQSEVAFIKTPNTLTFKLVA